MMMARHGTRVLVSSLVIAAAVGTGAAPLPAHRVYAGAELGRVSASTAYVNSGGTLMVSGSMRSAANITMTGAFSVGHASNLSWSLPLPRTLRVNGYTEIVGPPVYRFSVAPSWSRVGRQGGNPVTTFHWNAPPSNTVIHVVEQLHVDVQSSLAPFRSRAAYPLSALPRGVRPYTNITHNLHLFHHGRGLAHQLARGHRSEQGVVEAVANWVASHLRYDDRSLTLPVTASSVLRHPGTTCRGYANVMAALLRYQGIPSQVVYGWVSSTPIKLHGPGGAMSLIQWAGSSSQGETHAWLQIYFPHAGWVPFDPQHEKFFIDPRHFAFAVHKDAPAPNLGPWTATAPDGQSATGAPLSNGSYEIAPGDGVASAVTVSTRDDFHAVMGGIHHDVSGVLLLSR